MYEKWINGLLARRPLRLRGQPVVKCFLGPPGSGKSRWAMANLPADDTFWKPAGAWWDGYVGQKYVVFDDFADDNTYSPRGLLNVIDFYPLLVPVKGAFVPLRAEVFIFTTNIHPRDWFPAHPAVIAPLHRRFHFSDECGVYECVAGEEPKRVPWNIQL